MPSDSNVVKLPTAQAQRVLPPSLSGTVGAAGTKIFSGLVLDDYNPDLSGLKAVNTYDKMRRGEPMVQAVLFSCELPIRSSRWYIEPASDNPMHVALGDFVHDSLFNFGHQTFDDFMRLILGKLWAGYSWFEKIFAYDERGYLLWDQFAYRHQNTVFQWKMDDNNPDVLKGVLQLAPPTYAYHDIPAEKLLVYSFRQEGNNFQGISLLRTAYKPWFILDYLTKVANIGYERMAGGLAAMAIPDGAEDALVQKAVQVVENLRMGDEQAGITYPSSLDFKIHEVGGKMMDHLNAYLEQQRLAIARSVLAAHINMPGSAPGSLALSRDTSQLFLDSLEATADQAAGVFNLNAIPQLLDLNFQGLKREDYPKLVHSKIGQRDMRYIGRSLGELSKNGLLTPGPELEEHIREILDLPDIPDDQRSMPLEQNTAEDAEIQDRGAAGAAPASPTAAVPAPSNLPAARAIASQPWRPSTRLQRMSRPYVIRGGKAPTREALNTKADKQVTGLRSVISRAMRDAKTDAKGVLEQQRPGVSASQIADIVRKATASSGITLGDIEAVVRRVVASEKPSHGAEGPSNSGALEKVAERMGEVAASTSELAAAVRETPNEVHVDATTTVQAGAVQVAEGAVHSTNVSVVDDQKKATDLAIERDGDGKISGIRTKS